MAISTTACGGWWDDEPETLAEDATAAESSTPAPVTLSTADLGEVEIEISGIGSRTMVSSSRWSDDNSRRRVLQAGPNATIQAPSTLTTGLDIQPQSSSSVDIGTRGAGGVRYLSATFRVRNAQACGASGNCTAYSVPRSNLTFLPVLASSTIANTAFVRFTRQDDQPASIALAAQLLPTHGMNSIATAVEAERASLQLFREHELPSADLLSYGFVVNNINNGSRTLPANPAAGQFDGLVTFAYKIPLQANAADDPFKISIRLRATQDSNTRVSQSLEETDASVIARAASLSATDIAVPCNKVSTVPNANPMCSVRVAGAASAALSSLTFLAPRQLASTSYGTRNAVNYFVSGHSLTDDPLAANIASIAQSLGRQANWNQQILLGSPIRSRTRGGGSSGWAGYSLGKNRSGKDMNVINELRNGTTLGSGQRYDSLLITERHDLPSTLWWEDTVKYLRHFHERLIEGRAQSNSYFYQSWLEVKKTDPAPWVAYERAVSPVWQCAATRINSALAHEGRTDRILSVPANWALAELVSRATSSTGLAGITGANLGETMNRIFTDDVHLTPLGVYYLSLVSYSSLYGSAPFGAWKPASVTDEQAKSLQVLAWDAVSAFVATQAPRSLEQCRTYMDSTFCQANYDYGVYSISPWRSPTPVSTCRSQFTPATDANPFFFNATNNAGYWFAAP